MLDFYEKFANTSVSDILKCNNIVISIEATTYLWPNVRIQDPDRCKDEYVTAFYSGCHCQT